MKSKYLLLITAVLLSVSFSSFAQMSVIVHKNDGTTHEFMFSDVDSLKFSKIQPGMVFVEGGRFWQGARDSTSSSNQYPLHQVELSDFYILNTEVTYGLWRSVMDTIPGYKNSDDHPAVSISFYEMVDFCNKLSASENRTPCYYYIDTTLMCDFTKNGYRLPTEAEWEYAARGGKYTKDYIYSGSNNPDEVAWYKSNCTDYQPVKQKKPNELGLYDMTGNVYEVCWDNYQRYYYSTLPQLSINPTGPATSQFENGKLIRGGAFWDTEPDTNAGRASMSVLVNGTGHTGFRIVISSGR